MLRCRQEADEALIKMRKRTCAAILLSVTACALMADAQAPAPPKLQLGKTAISAAVSVTSFLSTGGTYSKLTGGVVVQSPTYHLNADHAFVTSRQTKVSTQSPFAIIDAYGNTARGTQVVGYLLDKTDKLDPDRRYTIYADHLVYTPDDTRPQGGTIDLTGHPKVIVHDPKDFAAKTDAVTIAPHIVIELGLASKNYPVITVDNGTTTFTPLQQ